MKYDLDTVVAAPMTTIIRTYPTRIHYVFQKKKGQVAIDQIRSLDKTRLVKKVGILNEQYCKIVGKMLLEYFASPSHMESLFITIFFRFSIKEIKN